MQLRPERRPLDRVELWLAVLSAQKAFGVAV
jgi:hypothetical protein